MSRTIAEARHGGLDRTETAVVRQVASILLRYPDERVVAALPAVRQAVASLPDVAARASLTGFLDAGFAGAADDETAAQALAEHYVEILDLRRRCSLYLTYYRDGDTRRRGMSLARLKVRYRAAGLVPPDGELPDYLPVVLEYAVRVPDDGEAVLQEHRAAVELLRISLGEAGSPYADVLAAVTATLPGPSPEDRRAVQVLVQQGPPQEEVGVGGLPGGLDPYAVDPSLIESGPTPVFVPLSDLAGASGARPAAGGQR